MRIFQIGFNDCGEASIAHLLHKSGVRTLYGPGRYWHLQGHPAVARRNVQRIIARNIDEGRPAIASFEDFQAFCGMEFAQNGWVIENFRHFATLAEEHRDALFILNTCDSDDWLARRIARDDGLYLDDAMQRTGISRRGVLNLWRDDFHRHHAMVREYFYARPKALFEFDIARHNAKDLARFLRPAARVWPRFYRAAAPLPSTRHAA